MAPSNDTSVIANRRSMQVFPAKVQPSPPARYRPACGRGRNHRRTPRSTLPHGLSLHPGIRYRTGLFRHLPRREATRCVLLRGLRGDSFRQRHQVRLPERLAELPEAGSHRGRRHPRRRRPRHGPHRDPVCLMRSPPGPRVPRWPGTDGRPILYQLGLPCLRTPRRGQGLSLSWTTASAPAPHSGLRRGESRFALGRPRPPETRRPPAVPPNRQEPDPATGPVLGVR